MKGWRSIHIGSRYRYPCVTVRAMTSDTAHRHRSLDSHESQGRRSFAAAADRNKEAILEVIKPRLPSAPSPGTLPIILEVASGTGQHVAYLATALPHLTWQPTEASPETLDSITAWTEGAPNVLPPKLLDCLAPPQGWPVGPKTCFGVVCINMSHISPWQATCGLMEGAGRALRRGGRLFLYGPFLVEGVPTTESNAAFDRSLRAQNGDWGLRDVAMVDAAARDAGLSREEMIPMPANNFTLVYVKLDDSEATV